MRWESVSGAPAIAIPIERSLSENSDAATGRRWLVVLVVKRATCLREVSAKRNIGAIGLRDADKSSYV